MILLDTNICVYVIKARPAALFERFNAFEPGQLGVSVVTAMELRVGALRAAHAHVAARVEALLTRLTVHALSSEVVEPFAQLKTRLMAQGEMIGPFDLLIAAHALSLGATLVTNNRREFDRVPGLPVENWP